MIIESVRAVAITNPAVLGRGRFQPAPWHDEIDHMNPLADDPRYRGQARRFEPPWPEVLCVVTIQGGEWGVGMTGLAGPAVSVINDYLGPLLIGEPANDIERLWLMMATAGRAHLGVGAVTGYAISAIDLALWDLRGRRANTPVWALIGGDPDRKPLDCYATGLSVQAHLEQGFSAFKLACPWGPERAEAVQRTADLVGDARRLIGPDGTLMLDGWAVSHWEDAVAVIEATSSAGLHWIEDIVDPHDDDAYRRVRRNCARARLAAGERWYSVDRFVRAVDEGWVDVVQPDVQWVGGVTATVEIARRAAAGNTELAIHCGGNDSFGQHLAYGLAGNRWAELYLANEAHDSLMDSYRATPGMASPVGGKLRPTDAPGFGIELTSTDIARLMM